jgi:hypothetical protein
MRECKRLGKMSANMQQALLVDYLWLNLSWNTRS